MSTNKKRKVESEDSRKKKKKRSTYKKGWGKPVPRTSGAFFAGENKYWDVDRSRVDIPACNTTGLVTALTTSPDTYQTLFSPVTGSGVNNREGRRCAVKKIRIVGSIEYPGQMSQNQYDDSILVRVVLFLDQQANASTPGLSDIYRTAPISVGTFAAIRQPINLANAGRFRILKDKLYKFDNYQTIGLTSSFIQMPQVIPFKFTIKFKKPLIFLFTQTGGSLPTALLNYNLNLQANATVNSISPQAQVFINYQSRVTFVDA